MYLIKYLSIYLFPQAGFFSRYSWLDEKKLRIHHIKYVLYVPKVVCLKERIIRHNIDPRAAGEWIHNNFVVTSLYHQ